MKSRAKYWPAFLKYPLLFFFTSIAALAAPPFLTVTTNSSVIGRYDVYELTMSNSLASYANPWDDPVISAAFTSPSGVTNTVGGFYSYTNTWKVRFAPREIGSWTWTLSYVDSNGVFNATGGFICTNSSNIGFLRRNPTNAYIFVTDAMSNAFRVFGFDCRSI